MPVRVLVLCLLALLLALGASACGGDDDGASDEPAATGTATTDGDDGGGDDGEAGEGDAAAGEAVFAEAGCGGCHTLAAANSSGTVGPNLDEADPDFDLVVERVTNGKGAMPSFEDRLSEQQIRDVAAFVSESASG